MASGTMTSPLLVSCSRVASLGSSSQVSGTTSVPLIICRIHSLLVGGHADALVGVDEALFRGAVFHIDVNQSLHDDGHLVCGKGGAEDLADRRVAAGLPAQGYLIELLAFLVHAENADMTDVMVATGVHAA